MQNEIQPIIDPISSLLQSRVLKVKEKITKGQIILEINPTQFESSFDTKLIDQTIYSSHEQTHSNLNSHLPQIDDYKLIRKICLKSRQPKELLNPKEIIIRRRKQFQDRTQNDKRTSFKIFRTTKSMFRSISKEIDKRTKQQFGLVKKSFNFMQYDNFFHPCSKLSLKANDNSNSSIKCFNLPFLKLNSSFLSKNLLDMTIDNKINSIQMLPRKISTNQEYSIISNSNSNNNRTIAIEDNIKKSIKRHNEKYSLSKIELKREISLKKLSRASLNYF